MNANQRMKRRTQHCQEPKGFPQNDEISLVDALETHSVMNINIVKPQTATSSPNRNQLHRKEGAQPCTAWLQRKMIRRMEEQTRYQTGSSRSLDASSSSNLSVCTEHSYQSQSQSHSQSQPRPSRMFNELRENGVEEVEACCRARMYSILKAAIGDHDDF